MRLIELVRSYKELKKLRENYNYNCYCTRTKGFKNVKTSQELDELYLVKLQRINELEGEVSKLIREFNKTTPIKLQNPQNVIGARVTSKFKEVDLFDCNDLTNIKLSEKKNEGLVLMPYLFDENGNEKRSKKSYQYKIRRVDNDVYLVVDENMLSYK